MFSAPTRSAWSVYPQRTHWNFSCVGRFSSATCPQCLRGQVREGLRGSTGISLRPALSALCARMPEEPPQPAWWMLLFTPGLRCSSVREKRARVAGVGLGLWRADHVRDAQPFVRDHVVLADYRQGGLVRVILPPAAHPCDAAWRPSPPHGDAGRFGCPACTGGNAVNARWASARASTVRLPCRGFGLVHARGCGEEVGHAHVDTGHHTGPGERFGGHLVTGQDDLPLPAPALDAD